MVLVRFCEVCGAAFQSLSTCPRDNVRTRANLTDPLLTAVLGERYKILERVAAGGMGQVYLAAHTRIACLFAVKVLYGDLAFDPSMQARFLREAEVASCLQSRHIVRVVDFGQSEAGLPYLVMEYLDGPTLFDVIAREGAIQPRRAARIAQKIARGLSHAHERGIVHRDLKSENVILVLEDDEPDIPRLLDFGVARLKESGNERLTSAGYVLGTPLYMAPEQFLGGEVDARADLYALGIILFEMLTGVPPFEAPTMHELAQKHLIEKPPSLSASLPSADAGLEAIVHRLLAKDPGERFQSARELVEALGDTQPVRPSATPSLSPGRTGRVEVVAPPIVARVEATILEGAPIYNAGDHARCAALYQRTVEALVAEVKEPIAVAARLRTGLRRATDRKPPTLAAWELRYTFDDLLFAGQIAEPGSDLIEHELAAYSSIAARRESAMHLGILGDFALDFACMLSERLREKNIEPEAATLLEKAATEAVRMGSGQTGLAPLQQAIDQLRARFRRKLVVAESVVSAFAPTADGAVATKRSPVVSIDEVGPSIPPVPARATGESLPPSGASDELCDAIVRAISIGAPAYNEGRFEVCHRVYRETNETLRSRLATDPAGVATARWLTDVATRASSQPDRDAAWVYRHAFDALLASRRRA